MTRHANRPRISTQGRAVRISGQRPEGEALLYCDDHHAHGVTVRAPTDKRFPRHSWRSEAANSRIKRRPTKETTGRDAGWGCGNVDQARRIHTRCVTSTWCDAVSAYRVIGGGARAPNRRLLAGPTNDNYALALKGVARRRPGATEGAVRPKRGLAARAAQERRDVPVVVACAGWRRWLGARRWRVGLRWSG
jgi:hypothetical protein